MLPPHATEGTADANQPIAPPPSPRTV